MTGWQCPGCWRCYAPFVSQCRGVAMASIRLLTVALPWAICLAVVLGAMLLAVTRATAVERPAAASAVKNRARCSLRVRSPTWRPGQPHHSRPAQPVRRALAQEAEARLVLMTEHITIPNAPVEHDDRTTLYQAVPLVGRCCSGNTMDSRLVSHRGERDWRRLFNDKRCWFIWKRLWQNNQLDVSTDEPRRSPTVVRYGVGQDGAHRHVVGDDGFLWTGDLEARKVRLWLDEYPRALQLGNRALSEIGLASYREPLEDRSDHVDDIGTDEDASEPDHCPLRSGASIPMGVLTCVIGLLCVGLGAREIESRRGGKLRGGTYLLSGFWLLYLGSLLLVFCVPLSWM